MTDQNAPASEELIELSGEIVSAYVSHNKVTPNDIPKLIADVYAALAGLGAEPTPPIEEAPEPAISVLRSITPDFLICLDDGKRFKSLKRHLRGLGMTPEEYRAKWGLPPDYPMVAPNYSTTRSTFAKTNGLGRKPAVMEAGQKRKRRADAVV